MAYTLANVLGILDIVPNTVRYLLPKYATRIPYTNETALYLVLPIVILVVMAGLARTPSTSTLRLALLPLAVAATLRMCFGYFYDGPENDGLNHGLRTSFSRFWYLYSHTLTPLAVSQERLVS